jgi:hypothetical protein
MIGDVGVRGYGLRASSGRKPWESKIAGGDDDEAMGGRDAAAEDASNKLYVGLLIMLIFSEALAL